MTVQRPGQKIFPLKRVKYLGVFSLLVFVIILSYSNTFEAPFVFDDRRVVFEELIQVNRLSEVSFSWLAELIKTSRSVAYLSFAFNFYLGGLNVFGYHLVNIIIHILVAWTVFLFIRVTLNLSGSPPERSERIALITSLIFAVHPIQTQAVTYIVQRETSLAGFFYLGALLSYIHARLTGGRVYYLLCVLSGLLAVGSKQNTAILPVTIFFYEFYFFRERKKEWLKKNWYIPGLIILLPVVIGLVYTGPNMVSWVMDGYAERDFSLIERVLTEQRVLLHYLSLVIAPVPWRFCLQHDLPLSHGLSPATVIAIAFHLVAAIVAIKSARSRPVLSFSILWFYLHHLIESSVLALELVYEHRMYLPSIGLFYIVGLCYHMLADGIGSRRKIAAVGILFVVLSALGLSTYFRNRVWASNESIWEDVLRKNPDSLRALQNLGNAYLEHGRSEDARQQFEKALRLDNENVTTLNNLGVLYKQEQKWQKAQEYFDHVLQLLPGDKVATSNLAEMYSSMQRYGEAENLFKDLIERYPENYWYHYRLALVFIKGGQYDKAAIEFLGTLRLKPDFKKAFLGLWESLQSIQPVEKAQIFLEDAVAETVHPVSRGQLSSMLRAIKKHIATEDTRN